VDPGHRNRSGQGQVPSNIPCAWSTPQTLLRAAVLRFIKQQSVSTFYFTKSTWQPFNPAAFPRRETETRETMQLAQGYTTWEWHIYKLDLVNSIYF
jgi:hypothetical protein